jgi:hypothetical protein
MFACYTRQKYEKAVIIRLLLFIRLSVVYVIVGMVERGNKGGVLEDDGSAGKSRVEFRW